nr:MAG TPA: hypothetical protein [Caudoviricetes sp.]
MILPRSNEKNKLHMRFFSNSICSLFHLSLILFNF